MVLTKTLSASVSTGDDKIDVFRLPTVFHPGYVEHHIPFSDQRRKIRRGTRLKKWNIKREIGRGGFGVVHLQEEERSRRLRAVKQLLRPADQENALDPLRELIAMATLSKDLTNFVELKGWYQNETHLYIAMEYFELGDLVQCVTAPLPEAESQKIVFQVAEALEFMHARHFTHRDLKPSNIFVVNSGPNWWVKVADFGVSKQVLGGDTSLHTSLTGDFMAPEILGFTDDPCAYTNAVDLWSLGCLASWLLSHHVLVDVSKMFMFSRGRFALPLDILSAKMVSKAGLDFVSHLLVYQPDLRMTALAAVNHEWLLSHSSHDGVIDDASSATSRGSVDLANSISDQTEASTLSTVVMAEGDLEKSILDQTKTSTPSTIPDAEGQTRPSENSTKTELPLTTNSVPDGLVPQANENILSSQAVIEDTLAAASSVDPSVERREVQVTTQKDSSPRNIEHAPKQTEFQPLSSLSSKMQEPFLDPESTTFSATRRLEKPALTDADRSQGKPKASPTPTQVASKAGSSSEPVPESSADRKVLNPQLEAAIKKMQEEENSITRVVPKSDSITASEGKSTQSTRPTFFNSELDAAIKKMQDLEGNAPMEIKTSRRSVFEFLTPSNSRDNPKAFNPQLEDAIGKMQKEENSRAELARKAAQQPEQLEASVDMVSNGTDATRLSAHDGDDGEFGFATIKVDSSSIPPPKPDPASLNYTPRSAAYYKSRRQESTPSSSKNAASPRSASPTGIGLSPAALTVPAWSLKDGVSKEDGQRQYQVIPLLKDATHRREVRRKANDHCISFERYLLYHYESDFGRSPFGEIETTTQQSPTQLSLSLSRTEEVRSPEGRLLSLKMATKPSRDTSQPQQEEPALSTDAKQPSTAQRVSPSLQNPPTGTKFVTRSKVRQRAASRGLSFEKYMARHFQHDFGPNAVLFG